MPAKLFQVADVLHTKSVKLIELAADWDHGKPVNNIEGLASPHAWDGWVRFQDGVADPER